MHQRLPLLLVLMLGVIAIVVLVGNHETEPLASSSTTVPLEETPPTPSMLILAPHAEEQAREGQRPTLTGRPARMRPPRKRRAALSALARAGGYIESLQALEDVSDSLAEDASVLPLLDEAFQAAEAPVARQNLIFHVANTVAAEESVPWLTRVAAGAGPDADDATMALAGLGDESAIAALEARAAPDSTLAGGAPDWSGIKEVYRHEALGKRNDAEARVLLRPYRAVEVLRQRVYFLRTHRSAWVRWRSPGPPPPAALVKVLLAWRTRYPNHPGADDVALYVARARVAQGRIKRAAKWFARSVASPDGDAAEESLRGLLGCAEVLLEPEDLRDLLVGVENASRVEDLITYVRIRRSAAAGELERAVADVRYEAVRAPEGFFGAVWDTHTRLPAPKGLQSGLTRLSVDDPLLALPAASNGGPQHDFGAAAGRRSGTFPLARNRTASGPVMLPDVTEAARQVQLWGMLAQLQQRTTRVDAEQVPDLLYKQAALHFHNPTAFFPAYARRGDLFDGLIGQGGLRWQLPDEDRWDAALERAETEWHGEFRAIELFERIESRFSDYGALDRVVFSIGQALRRLVAGWPSRARREATKRAIVPTFERFLQMYPESTLVPDAKRALAYWRAICPPLASDHEILVR